MTRLCPFCHLEREQIIDCNDVGFVIRDGFPISPGHTLIISRRHVGSYFELYTEEREGLFRLLDRAKSTLDHELRPNAYNIGINDGLEAGQTIQHVHIHLIPRYQGDAADPRGGIRWVMPDKAKYCREVS